MKKRDRKKIEKKPRQILHCLETVISTIYILDIFIIQIHIQYIRM